MDSRLSLSLIYSGAGMTYLVYYCWLSLSFLCKQESDICFFINSRRDKVHHSCLVFSICIQYWSRVLLDRDGALSLQHQFSGDHTGSPLQIISLSRSFHLLVACCCLLLVFIFPIRNHQPAIDNVFTESTIFSNLANLPNFLIFWLPNFLIF